MWTADRCAALTLVEPTLAQRAHRLLDCPATPFRGLKSSRLWASQVGNLLPYNLSTRMPFEPDVIVMGSSPALSQPSSIVKAR